MFAGMGRSSIAVAGILESCLGGPASETCSIMDRSVSGPVSPADLYRLDTERRRQRVREKAGGCSVRDHGCDHHATLLCGFSGSGEEMTVKIGRASCRERV